MAAKGSSTGRKTTKSPAVKKTGSKSTKTTAAKTTAKKANTTKNTKSAPKRETTRMPESRERFGDSILDEVILIVIIVISAVVFISQITSKMGVVGQVIGGLFQGLLGISGVLLPVLVIIYCIWMLMSEERKWPLVRAFGGALFLLTVASAAYLFHPLNVSGDLGFAKKAMELFDSGSLTNGGLIGGLFGGGLFGLLDALGSVIVLLAMLVISIILATGRSFFGAMGTLADHQKVRRQVRNEKIKNKADRIRQEEKMEAARLEKQEAKRRRVMNKEDFNIELHEVEATEHPEVKETVFRQKKQDYSVKKREPIYDFVKENEMPMEEPKWDFNVVFGGKLQVDELEQGTQMPPRSTERFKVVEPLKEVAKKQEPVEMTEEEAVYEKIFGEDNTVENMAEENARRSMGYGISGGSPCGGSYAGSRRKNRLPFRGFGRCRRNSISRNGHAGSGRTYGRRRNASGRSTACGRRNANRRTCGRACKTGSPERNSTAASSCPCGTGRKALCVPAHQPVRT